MHATFSEPRNSSFILMLIMSLMLSHVAVGQQNPNGQLPVTSVARPYLFLIRDPAVYKELDLSPSQLRAMVSLNDELGSELWSMRNKSAEHIDATMNRARATAEASLTKILSNQQQQRLAQIELQTLATRAFLHDRLPHQLQIAEESIREIRAVIHRTQQAINGLFDGDSDELGQVLQEKGRNLWAQGQEEIFALLSDKQKTRWRILLGKKIDLSKLGYVTFKAPELQNSGKWINSSPTTLKQLKGKVVALHFYAFG